MPAIDSDAHVIETPLTWEYLRDDEKHFTPTVVQRLSGGEARALGGGAIQEYWVVGGRLLNKQANVGADTTAGTREMSDIEARLRHMDALDVDVQVLYPTLFLQPVTADVELEYALCRAYNRWLADIWKQAPDRLRWVALPPLLSMDKLADELAFAKEHGAVGVMVRGVECERMLSDAYFYPLYELAGALDLAVCPHSGTGGFVSSDLYRDDPGFNKFKLATIGAFHSLLWHGVPARFPKVRWGFIEVSAQWIPYVLNDLGLRLKRRGEALPDNVMGDNNIYVACQVTDDLPYILQHASEDHIVIGTDYGHADTASEIEALRKLKTDGRIEPRVIDKILDDNARALYGL